MHRKTWKEKEDKKNKVQSQEKTGREERRKRRPSDIFQTERSFPNTHAEINFSMVPTILRNRLFQRANLATSSKRRPGNDIMSLPGPALEDKKNKVQRQEKTGREERRKRRPSDIFQTERSFPNTHAEINFSMVPTILRNRLFQRANLATSSKRRPGNDIMSLPGLRLEDVARFAL